MPQQEVFFEQAAGDRYVKVLKTYDQNYAREAFDNMDGLAQTSLWNALNIEVNCSPDETPEMSDGDYEDFLWNELLEAAREDGSLLSFFVVNETTAGSCLDLFVSPDWPSAEAFAKNRISSLQ